MSTFLGKKRSNDDTEDIKAEGDCKKETKEAMKTEIISPSLITKSTITQLQTILDDKSKETPAKESEVSNKNIEKPPQQTTLDSMIKSTITSSNGYPSTPDVGTLKIVSWNICGLRPLLSKTDLNTLIEKENPDIICFNETKINNALLTKNGYKNLKKETYHSFWNCSTTKEGYSGTAILTKYEPIAVTNGIGIEKHDGEGRVITAEYPTFYLISCYTPNAGEGLKRVGYRVNEWDKDLFDYIEKLSQKKDIVLCGDLNVAILDIDIYEPKGHDKTPGFSPAERQSFRNFLKRGFVDTYRINNPNEKKYSFFTKRAKMMKENNKGWRLDYFIVNEKAKERVIKSEITDKDIYNASDHLPIILDFTI